MFIQKCTLLLNIIGADISLTYRHTIDVMLLIKMEPENLYDTKQASKVFHQHGNVIGRNHLKSNLNIRKKLVSFIGQDI